MQAFEVLGSKRLQGEIVPQGAKNEALQILSAVLLTPEPVTINNIPDILDVNLLIDLLEDLGVKVNRVDRHTCIFEAKDVELEKLEDPAFQKNSSRLRGSVMIAGPLLARELGEEEGVKFEYEQGEGFFRLTANELEGTNLLLDEPSVTGTANILFAAVMAKGTTTIYNAACEPYIQQLCKMLNRMGAKITGISSNLLKIEGVDALGGTTHSMLPDMIEVGSFIGLAAMTQSQLTIKNAGIQHLGIIPQKFQQLGIDLEFKNDDIIVNQQDVYEIHKFIDGSVLTIYDHPWPGMTPDLLSILLVVATQAKGSVLIHQKMFESRLFFVDKLIDMGARIILCDPHRAAVIGLEREQALRGITMSSPDIRAGVALLIAALSAEGKSIIQNIEQIDRGYQYIDKRLTALGASIKRIDA